MWFRKDFAFSSARYAPIALALLLAHAFPTIAQVTGFDLFTAPGSEGISIAAGSVYTIKWTPSPPAGQISLILLEGVSTETLQLGPTIADSIQSTAGSYAWQVPSDPLGFSVFAFKLVLASDPTTFQYSYPFFITSSSATKSAESPVSTLTVSAVYSTSSTSSDSSPASVTSPSLSSFSSSATTSHVSSSSTLAPLSNPSSSSTAPSTLSSSTSSTSPSPSSTASNDSLTTGAKAGIGIGASLGGILLLALIAFTFFRYGKRAAMKSDANAGTWEKAELGTGRPDNVELPAGSSGGGIAELPGGERDIAELEAGMKSERREVIATQVEKGD